MSGEGLLNINKITDLPLVSREKFLECDCHIGLPAKFWNPKMKEYITSKVRGKYIFDENKCLEGLQNAYNLIFDCIQYDLDVIFVGVKNKNTSPIIQNASKRVKVFHMTQR